MWVTSTTVDDKNERITTSETDIAGRRRRRCS